MVKSLKISFRNVFRNKRRTLITIAGIVIGSAFLAIFGGFVEYVFWGMKESTIHSGLGHIQVYKKNYLQGEPTSFKYSLSRNEVEMIEKIAYQHGAIEVATPRINFSGIVGNQEISAIFNGIGGIAENEQQINLFSNIEGEELTIYDKYGILIGKELAKKLTTRIGDSLILMSSCEDGSLNAIHAKVRGTLNTGIKQMDNMILNANLEMVKELQYTDNVHSIVMLLTDTKYTTQVSKFLKEEFKKNNLNVTIKTWEDLAETYHQVVNLYKASFNVVTLIILLIVIFSIANTLYMSVMERVREIGTIMAIGLPKRIIIRLFLLEGVIIGIVGTVLGISVAFLGSKLINSLYIIMPPPPGATEGYPLSIFINFPLVVKIMALSIIISLLASLYPALKASKLRIVDALRYI